MSSTLLLVLCGCVAMASCVPLVAVEHEHAPAHYEFQYSVHDEHSGDIKQQQESRHGDDVQGSYSLLQPDGLKRLVHYQASKEHGFTADVTYEGHKQEQAPAKISYAAAPVAQLAYHAAPITKLAYTAAPAAQLTYHAAPAAAQISYHSAPVAKIAYAAAPASQVTYHAAPVAKISYAAAPAAQLTYHAAPVAKLSYSAAPAHISAPLQKIAYSENLSHVTFSSPIISYHH